MTTTSKQNQNPKTLGRWAFCLLILGFSFSERASAATVQFVGSETGSPGNGYSVQNWSNAGVTKVYDIGGSERFGLAGYYQFNPRAEGSAGGGVPLSANSDLMVTSPTYPNLISNPNLIPTFDMSFWKFIFA